jgi:hypothetical protein
LTDKLKKDHHSSSKPKNEPPLLAIEVFFCGKRFFLSPLIDFSGEKYYKRID